MLGEDENSIEDSSQNTVDGEQVPQGGSLESQDSSSDNGLEDKKINCVTVAGEENENLKWYVIHTYSGFEEKAKKALIQRSKEKKLDHKVGEVHIPQTQKETITKTGKKRIVSHTSFPGYMMAQLDLDDLVKVLVKDTPKITGFVGNSQHPKPLPDREVRSMLDTASEVENEVQSSAEPEVMYSKGDSVKVIDGPFSNFDGIIDEVRPEKSRVRVLVSIFGRETPVELEFGQIEQV